MRDMQLPAALAEHARRKVRIVAGERGPHADAIFDLLALTRRDWTLPDWGLALVALDRCELSVADWFLTL